MTDKFEPFDPDAGDLPVFEAGEEVSVDEIEGDHDYGEYVEEGVGRKSRKKALSFEDLKNEYVPPKDKKNDTIIPSPELIQSRPWEVKDGNPRLDVNLGIFSAPHEKFCAYQQAILNTRLAISPPDPAAFAASAEVSSESFETAEDYRASRRLNVDVGPGEYEKSLLVKKLTQINESYNENLKADVDKKQPEWIFKYELARAYVFANQVSKVKTYNNEVANFDSDNLKLISIGAVNHVSSRVSPGKYVSTSILNARMLDELLEDVDKKTKHAFPKDGWWRKTISRPTLTKEANTFRIGKASIFKKVGTVPKKWSAWATSKRVFEKIVANESIAIAIDGSGSMSCSSQRYEALFKRYPEATVLVYSSPTIFIAARGRRYLPVRNWPQLPGDNGFDYYAMEWLAKQPVTRRFLVSDGGYSFNASLPDGGVREMWKLCKKFDIKRVQRIEDLIPAIRGSRKPCRFIVPPWNCEPASANLRKEMYGRYPSAMTRVELLDRGNL